MLGALRPVHVVGLAALVPACVAAQSPLERACGASAPALAAGCFATAQAALTARPPLGFLLLPGNPTPGAASAAGLHLGLTPRLSATVRTSVVRLRLPDVTSAAAAKPGVLPVHSAFLPSIGATAGVELYRGRSLVPTVAGIGALELLAAAAWTPAGRLAADGSGTGDLAFGGGLRIGILRESFGVPGVSVAVLRTAGGSSGFGAACASGTLGTPRRAVGYSAVEGVCVPGDAGTLGEARMDGGFWSGRGIVAKHVRGLGLSAGVGYDRHAGQVSIAARSRAPDPGVPGYRFVRVIADRVEQARWSAFADGAFTRGLTSLVAGLGWIQGTPALVGYPASASDYRPGAGAVSGSVGVRVSL